MSIWCVEKGKGIFNNRRLPNLESLLKSIDDLSLEINKGNIGIENNNNDDLKRKIIRTLHNYQSCLYTWQINKDCIGNVSQKIIVLLQNIKKIRLFLTINLNHLRGNL